MVLSRVQRSLETRARLRPGLLTERSIHFWQSFFVGRKTASKDGAVSFPRYSCRLVLRNSIL